MFIKQMMRTQEILGTKRVEHFSKPTSMCVLSSFFDVLLYSFVLFLYVLLC